MIVLNYASTITPNQLILKETFIHKPTNVRK